LDDYQKPCGYPVMDCALGVHVTKCENRIEELEAKLAAGTLLEYDDGSRVSLSAFAGGGSEGGAWSHLTLMKEEHDGAVSFRHYTAAGDWCSPSVSSTLAELKGQ